MQEIVLISIFQIRIPIIKSLKFVFKTWDSFQIIHITEKISLYFSEFSTSGFFYELETFLKLVISKEYYFP